ncbi:MAG: hypothetical protein L6R37_003485 [Teloschistes peruensis]|nr:MAG: hypothetical protein L6R37_003485 [Teloschistes peruensis]
MAHRERGTGRERERERERFVDDRRKEPREPIREREREFSVREPHRDFPSSTRGAPLNEFFVDGDGIHREVMQRELCKYLGSDALSRPGTYNGQKGYIVTAVRPFTSTMIEDLKMLSQDYEKEKREMNNRGYKGSPMRASPSAPLPNQSPDLPYAKSRTREYHDATDSNESEARYASSSRYPDMYAEPYPDNYSDNRMAPNYAMSSGYPSVSGYPPSQAPGYPSSSGYPSTATYPAGSTYPQGTNYLPTSAYPPSSGYMASGYTSTSAIPGNRNEPNYTYAELPGEYPSGYHYQQSSIYPGGSQANPRTAGAYPPYVTSAQDAALRGITIDDRGYDMYAGQMVSSQPGRSGFPAPSRGTPTLYDPPQPRDGYAQPRDGYARAEPAREERRRR